MDAVAAYQVQIRIQSLSTPLFAYASVTIPSEEYRDGIRVDRLATIYREAQAKMEAQQVQWEKAMIG